MKYKLSKLVIGLFACMAVILTINVKVHADSANVSVSSASGSVGDTVSVSVKVTPDADAMVQLSVSYDTNYLEYVSGGTNGVAGKVMEIFDEVKAGATGELVINFKLRAAGTTTVSVTDAQILSINGDDTLMNVNKSDGSVTINAATTASNDSTLSGLIVQAVSQNGDSTAVVFTPSFSSDVHEYKADLPSTTARLVVSTTLSDNNATTKVSGTRIDPGNNKTTITVVAEDGSQTQYVLYTTRASEETTETTSEGESSSSEETTTELDRSPKLINSLNKYLIQDFSLVTIPEGFEESTSTLDGETIAVLKGIAKELTLVCLADDAQGTNVEIYIFNEASGAMDKMVNITSSQKMYTIIPTDDNYVGPEGYIQTTLDVNGVGVKAWIKEEGSEFYVVYAMNWNGEKALYVYDTKEQTMQRFVDGNKSQNLEDEPEEENKEYLAMKKQYDDMYQEYVNDHSKKNKTIIALLVVIVLLIIGAVILIIRKKGDFAHMTDMADDDLEEIGADEQQSELKLDLMAQVNETKPVKLAEEVLEAMDEISEKSEESKENTDDNAQNQLEEVQNNEEVEIKTDEKTPTDEKVSENNSASAKERYEEVLIDMEEDEPFEIEFVDLDDHDDKK
jgi:hypothetical protein